MKHWLILSCVGALFVFSFGCSDSASIDSVACLEDGDCPVGEICKSSICVPGIAGIGDGDLPPGDVDIEGGQDVECTLDLHCSPGYVCDDSICVPEGLPDGDASITDGDEPDGDDNTGDGDGADGDEETWIGPPCISHADCNDGLFCNGTEICAEDMHCRRGELPCDDEVDCTDDLCDETTNQCSATSNNARCDDRDPCNGDEICDTQAGCQPGAPHDCDDGLPCTTDSCLPMSGCVNEPDHSQCTDGVDCTTDTCDPQDGCVFAAEDSLCEDGFPCTENTCDAVAGCQVLVHNDECEDGATCTVDQCSISTGCEFNPDNSTCPGDHLCRPGAPGSNETTGCAPPPECTIDAECDDDHWCNGEETCVDFFCVSGETVVCNDGVSCTEDRCDENTNGCVYTPINSRCMDETVCNGIEICNAELDCQLGNPLNCNDSHECTTDSCDSVMGCMNEPVHAMCNDATDCTVDLCSRTQGCTNQPDNSLCDDLVPCTTDLCDIVDGCSNTVDHDYCNDGFSCTTDTCTTVSNCVYETHNESCTDGISCTADSCVAGEGCVFTADDNLCEGDMYCDPNTGCTDVPVCYTDADCMDADVCNGAERCQNGEECVSGQPLNCADDLTGNHDSAFCDKDDGCIFSCTGNYVDCNNDLGNGYGNGCETLLGTVNDCQYCDDVCTAPAGSVPECTASGCDYSCGSGQVDCNDSCVQVVNLTYGVEVTANTCNSQNRITSYNCSNGDSLSGGSKEIYYKWVADRTSEVVILAETQNSWDHAMIVLNNQCGTGCAIISDDSLSGTGEIEGFYLNAPSVGYTYYFTMEGWAGACGSYRIGIATEEDLDCESTGGTQPLTFALVMLALFGGLWINGRRSRQGTRD